MYNLLKSELLKLKINRTLRYIFIGLCVVTLIAMVCEIIGLEKYRVPGVEMSLHGIYSFLIQLSGLKTILLLGGVFVIIFICTDFEQRIIQSAVSSGISKLKLYLSKCIICYISIAVFRLVHAIIPMLVVNIVYSFGEAFSFDIFLKMARVYLLSTLITCAIISIAIMVSYLFKSTGPAIGAYIVSIFICDSLVRVIEDYYDLKNAISENLIFGLCENLELDMSCGFIISAIIQGLVCIGVISFVSYWIFKKSELR